MAVTPTAAFALPLKYLLEMLADVAAYRTLVGAEDAAGAIPSIHYYGIDTPLPWDAATAYVLGQYCHPSAAAGDVSECTTAGTSGATSPDWPDVADETVADGDSLVWTARSRTFGAGDTAHVVSPRMAAIRHGRPFSLVGFGDSYSYGQIAGSVVHQMAADGKLLLAVEVDTPDAYTLTVSDAGVWWANTLGGLIAGLVDMAGAVDRLAITAIDVAEFVRSPEEDRADEGDHHRALLSIAWQGGVA